MYNNEALKENDRFEMLKSIGIKSINEIFDVIPSDVKMKDFNLDDGCDEMIAQKILNKISKQNKTDYLCFLGNGFKNRFIPPVISDVASRFEFLSCYTPYQAEISQGTLECMYEFQSMICTLTNQDVSNASVYDGATAVAEAILMAARITKMNKVFVASDINKNYIEVIKTYLWANDIELIVSDDCKDVDLCAKVYQNVNRFGELVDMPQKNNKELIISIVDLLSLVKYEPPKADITVGDVQSFGVGLNFGGASAGFIACCDKHKRQLPGRICGKTVDKNGKTAYCLTLQAREQHIRREKATSNICSNQALIAFISNLYIRKIGKTGLLKIAQDSFDNAHKLAKELQKFGFELKNKEFFDEFTINVGNSDKFLEFMKESKILAGIKQNDSEITVSCTELNSEEDILQYVEQAKKLSLIKI